VPLPEAVAGAVDGTVAHLTGPVLGNAFDVNFGFSGMRRLAAQLRDTTTKSGFTRRFASPEAFASMSRRLYECLEVQHTAPGATRPLYAEFLDEAAALTGRPGYAEAAGLFRASAAHWSALAQVPAGFAACADLVDAARELEERAAATLVR
jgi:hypothetical protein